MNPLLQQTEQNYMAKVNPRLQPVVKKIVTAGHTFLYAPQTRQMVMQEMQRAKGDPEAIGQGVAKLVGILYTESKRTAPPQALIPAGFMLMCEVLQFIEDAGGAKVTGQLLADVTRATGSAILQLLGVHPEQVQQALAQAGQSQGGQGSPMGAPPAGPAPGAGIVGGAMQPAGGA